MAKRGHTKAEGLSAILSDEEIEALAEARRSLTPYLATGNRDRLKAFSSMAEFEDIVNQSGIWTPDRLQVFLDTQKVPPQNYFTQLQVYNGTRYRIVPENLQNVLRRGASLVLNDIDSMSEGLKTLKAVIADYSNGKVESNLYYSQPGHQAFPVHFDVHDVFAFQIEGRKRWRIYQQAHRFPINHLAFLSGDTAQHEKAKGDVSMEFVFRQGDVLYIPAGYYHQAICTDSTSLHLTFSAIEMIGLDVVSELFDMGVLTEFFRTPVARSAAGPKEVDEYVRTLSKEIETLVTSPVFVNELKRKLRNFSHPSGNISIRR
jgi:mannose-6-phosphate isomerase-like protein (cupin superfamily)